MRKIDLFLEAILNEKLYSHSNDYADKNNCEHKEILYFIQKIKDYNNKWLIITETNEGGGFFRINEGYEYEIKMFLENGGFQKLEQKEREKEELESENLKLIKAQQDEIAFNKKVAYAGLIASVLSLLLAVLSLLQE